jgi:hypothetical protein
MNVFSSPSVYVAEIERRFVKQLPVIPVMRAAKIIPKPKPATTTTIGVVNITNRWLGEEQ